MPVPRLKNAYPGAELLNAEPLVAVYDNFLTLGECKHIIKLAKPALQPAQVSAASAGTNSLGRTGGVHWIPHQRTPVISKVSQRISDLIGLPLAHAESLQVVHYGESEEYRSHMDAWDLTTERGQRCTQRGGQRLVTALLYLNDVAKGGGTAFPKLELTVDAKPGRMLLFHNCLIRSLTRDPRSLHAGMPVHSGEKWACNLWFREQAYQQ